jgi:hypothetical protein
MEVDKGRVVRGAANCRVGMASLVPGGERPRGGPLEKAAKREKKGWGKDGEGELGPPKDQAESGHHRSGRRGCASTVTPEADRQCIDRRQNK